MAKTNLIEKVESYKKVTKAALDKIAMKKGLSEKDKKTAQDFLSMCQNYYSDALHFEKKGDLPNALAALSYAHAWLDAGVRAKMFNAKGDSKLFTLP